VSVVKVGPLGLPALYEDNGKRVTTHSMLKTYLRCPKQAQYKYAERLKKKFVTVRDKPLKRGTWFHELLELYYKRENWKQRHKELTVKFNALMDEEKEAIGDLPVEVLAMMRSYLWHYGANKEDPMHGWEVIDTELTLECPWPDSEDGNDIYRCRVDALVRDQWGLLIVDHKTHKVLPNMTTRVLDAASPLYVWAARENGLDVRGFMWNYVRAKAPTVPKLVYVGTKREGLSTAAIDTDYPTYLRALKSHGLDPANHRERLDSLKRQRWTEGSVQTSSFYRRDILEKDDAMIARVVGAMMKTRDRMHEDYDDFEVVARVNDRSCEYMCDFGALCQTELIGGNSDFLRRKQFRTGDPLDYYQDIKKPDDE
jgi:hypothetical protein